MAKPKQPHGITRAKVIDCLDRGLTVRETALRLGIATQGVYEHLAAIRREKEGSDA